MFKFFLNISKHLVFLFLLLSSNNLYSNSEENDSLISYKGNSLFVENISSFPSWVFDNRFWDTISIIRSPDLDWNIFASNLNFFPEVSVLIIQNSALTEIPKNIVNLKKLKYLDLRGNHIRCLPRNFSKLKNLKVLDIDGNYGFQLNDNIDKLINLETLYASNIGIEVINKEIIMLKNLRMLYLKDNLLTSLPNDIYNLENIFFVSLSNNKFSDDIKKEIKLNFKVKGVNFVEV